MRVFTRTDLPELVIRFVTRTGEMGVKTHSSADVSQEGSTSSISPTSERSSPK